MRRCGLLFSFITVGPLLFANSVGATSITIINPSFELPAVGAGGFTDNLITGWTVSSPGISTAAGVFHPAAGELPPPTNGVQTAYINVGNISQVLGATLEPDALYTLAADFLARTDCCQPWPGSELDFMAGTTVLASAFIAPGALGLGGTQTSTVSFFSVPGNPFLGQPLEVRLLNTTNAIQINVDNVRLDFVSNIPEPASLILVGSVLGGWIGRRRMRRR